ncbi:hypothetical protein WK91_02030 [Burkholderia cepacia]|uniref:hypothetical protein n=1 Tax=Burkholderia cepacia TaxID=292 RepID=UPI00075C8838|nr:hypothetical protein [Burkholderia cepacia]KVW05380.1 hypothetical protein WK91_02030 [Burkholderia cepacia]
MSTHDIPDDPDNYSMRGVATHEAGHFVAARALGFQVNGLEVRRDPNRLRRDSYFYGDAETVIARPLADEQNLDLYLRHRVAILNAGAIAQAFDGAQVNERRLNSIRAHNGSDDLAKATEVFAVYLNCRLGLGKDEEYCSFEQWKTHPFWQECDEMATKIVRENWSAIIRIVDHVVQVFKTRDCNLVGKSTAQIVEIGWGAADCDTSGAR